MIASGPSTEVYPNVPMQEKRRYERLAVDLPVILRHGGRLIPATALNLSCGGMYLHADHHDIRPDLPVEVIFDLGDDQRDISMRGQILRVDREGQEPAGLGIRFTNLFSLSHKAVEHYVHQNLN